MKKLLFIAITFALLAAGCQGVELKKEQPSSPAASYEPLPK